ncbi:hypothetical protein [Bradyrhizobium sp. McL0616]
MWLAIESQLEAPPKVGRTTTEALSDYCRDNRISFDWMLTGLKKMADAR